MEHTYLPGLSSWGKTLNALLCDFRLPAVLFSSDWMLPIFLHDVLSFDQSGFKNVLPYPIVIAVMLSKTSVNNPLSP